MPRSPVTETALELMTVDKFLIWDDATDTRYELADGEIRAMAPPTGAHGTIVANCIALAHVAMRSRRPCRPQAEAGVRINEHTLWQADMAVTCKPVAKEIIEPMVVVEVLSPNTRTHDLGRKLDDYKALASVREIWMVDSERRWLQHWQRRADGWIGQDFVGQAHLQSEILGATVELDEVYADSGL